MWCVKCHWGSKTAMFEELSKCPMCGNSEFDDDVPFPKKPVRSIRANSKLVKAQVDKTSKHSSSEDVEDFLKDAKHRT